MSLSESDTRAKLIDPSLHDRGWTEDLIRREETAGGVEIVDGRPRRQSRGRVDNTLRMKVNPQTQPVALPLIGQGQTRGRTGLLSIEATTNQVCFAVLPNPGLENE